MKWKEVAGKLGGTVEAIAKLGIEPKPVPRHLIEPMAWNEVHGLALREGYDRRHFVPDDQGQICLLDTEANEERITRKYSHLLSETGATPIVRKKTLKNGAQVIDLPLLVAQRQIASSLELRKQVPKLYGEKPTEKGEPDYLKMGLGPQERLTQFALDRLPSLREQERLKNAETFSGRARNVEEDAIKVIGEKASATRQMIGVSAKNLLLVEAPKAGSVLAMSTAETLKAANKEAALLRNLTLAGVKRGAADVTAITLTVGSAAGKVVEEVTDAAQTGALDLTATAISKGIIALLKNPKP